MRCTPFPPSLSFVNSKGSPLFTQASLPAGPHSVEAARGDTFTFRALCRAGGADSTALGRVLVSSNLPENGWTGAKHSGSNRGWADCIALAAAVFAAQPAAVSAPLGSPAVADAPAATVAAAALALAAAALAAAAAAAFAPAALAALAALALAAAAPAAQPAGSSYFA